MGERTGISWTQHSWNPWHGCARVSPGCDHCYMFADKIKYGQDPKTVVRSKTTFEAPLKWKDPARVFTCSWSDFFIAQADDWREDAWNVIRFTPHLTYQILTKRPARIAAHLPHDWPLDNVWLGVSIESPTYLYRADVLRGIPAALRFLSLEPLLDDVAAGLNLNGIGWVIVGGESGANRRPFSLVWLERIAAVCDAAGVPLFVKQDAAFKPGQQGRIPDALWRHEFPAVPRPRGNP